MSKEIKCPACKKDQPIGSLQHDEDLNLRCYECKQVIFAVTAEFEPRLRSMEPPPPSYNMAKKEPLPIISPDVAAQVAQIEAKKPVETDANGDGDMCCIS